MQYPVYEKTTARDIMRPRAKLVVLHPEMDALAAVGMLVKRKISGAPVVDSESRYLGVFSEKTSMQFLLRLNYDALPSNDVQSFMNTEMDRVIDETTDLLTIIELFLRTPFRRLPVLSDDRLVGQVSRRDVLSKATSRLKHKQHSRHDHWETLYLSAIGAGPEAIRN